MVLDKASSGRKETSNGVVSLSSSDYVMSVFHVLDTVYTQRGSSIHSLVALPC